MSDRLRARLLYILLALGTIALGLGVHWWGNALGPTLRDVVGDALWAAMIVWWIGAFIPRVSLGRRAFAALAICFAVETSQLYHAPALDAVRRTTAGSLVLGSDFDPRDLVAYTLGVFGAVLAEWSVRRWLRDASQRAGDDLACG